MVGSDPQARSEKNLPNAKKGNRDSHTKQIPQLVAKHFLQQLAQPKSRHQFSCNKNRFHQMRHMLE